MMLLTVLHLNNPTRYSSNANRVGIGDGIILSIFEKFWQAHSFGPYVTQRHTFIQCETTSLSDQVANPVTHVCI
jgi:hypothetical protein